MLEASSSSGASHLEESDQYEEITFAAELHGIVDVNYVEEMLEKGMCLAHRLDTDEPIIQVGSHVFTAKWEKIVGSDLIFSELPHRHLLNFVGCSDRRLSAHQVLLVPKDIASLESKTAKLKAETTFEHEADATPTKDSSIKGT